MTMTIEQIRNTLPCREIKVLPTAETTVKGAWFHAKKLGTRTISGLKTTTFNIYDFQLNAGELMGRTGKNAELLRIMPSESFSVKGSGELDFALKNLPNGTEVLVEYLGVIKPTGGLGDKQNHYKIEVVEAVTA